MVSAPSGDQAGDVGPVRQSGGRCRPRQSIRRMVSPQWDNQADGVGPVSQSGGWCRPRQAVRRNGVAPVSPPSGGKADLCEQKAHILVKTWPCQPISVNVRLILKTQKALKVPNVSLIPIYVYKNRFWKILELFGSFHHGVIVRKALELNFREETGFSSPCRLT